MRRPCCHDCENRSDCPNLPMIKVDNEYADVYQGCTPYGQWCNPNICPALQCDRFKKKKRYL